MEPKPSDPGTSSQSELPFFSPKALPRSSSRQVGQETFASSRDGDTPHAVPDSPASALPAAPLSPFPAAVSPPSRAEALTRVLSEVRAIERRGSNTPRDRNSALTGARHAKAWCLGVPQIDDRLGPAGLDAGALHEIKPTLTGDGLADGCARSRPGSADAGSRARIHDRESDSGSDWGSESGSDWASAFTAALCFALALHLRRRIAGAAQPLLWCWPSGLAHELGRLHPAGLSSFGLDPAELILAEPDKSTDVLWAMEEGLKSGSVALVIGVLREAGLTPARRLALAAATTATPCLLVTDPRTPVTAATATRWRVGRAVSARHPFADRLDTVHRSGMRETLPGAPRYRVRLERCRTGGLAGSVSPLVLEWSDASYRFCLASPASDRAYREVAARRHRR